MLARSLARAHRHTQNNKAKKLTAVFAVSLSLSHLLLLHGTVVWSCVTSSQLRIWGWCHGRRLPPIMSVWGQDGSILSEEKKRRNACIRPPTNSTGLAASAHLPFPRLQISERQRLFNVCSQETSAHMFRGPEERHRLPVPNQCIFACVSPVNLSSVDSASIIHFS